MFVARYKISTLFEYYHKKQIRKREQWFRNVVLQIAKEILIT